ncbi:unnamed protein product [Blepharisma stoltei]|uniref:Uncharacterized protein n=1 Tax=Blepharisma stoltei TaxID=1481888 RepID=A0AAU9KHN6_9CILI|nr:unnamed protein product [Blepharisma stoltei]
MWLIVFLFSSFSCELIIERIPSTNPPPYYRSFSLMESYPNRYFIILYGGFPDPSSIFGDVWLFNTKDEIWNKLVPSNGVIPGKFYFSCKV